MLPESGYFQFTMIF